MIITGNGVRVKCIQVGADNSPVASGTPVKQLPVDDLQRRIHLVRGARVMLDADLARL